MLFQHMEALSILPMGGIMVLNGSECMVFLHNLPPDVVVTISLWMWLVRILNRTLHFNGMSIELRH